MNSSFAHDSRQLAEIYDRVSDDQLESGKRLVERLGIGAGAHVLDIGCGTGRLARWIAGRVGADGLVVGLDPLAERIDLARERTSGVRFEVGQAEDLGAFGDASFDAVCLSAVLHWVVDKRRALAEIRRVLRPGGRVGFTTVPAELGTAGTAAAVMARVLGRAPYAGHLDMSALPFASRGLTSTELIRLIVDSGLELVELHVMQRVLRYPGGAEFLDHIEASSFGNFLYIVPERLRASLRTDVIATVDADKRPDGVVMRDWVVRLVALRP